MHSYFFPSKQSLGRYLCSSIETVKRNEDKAKVAQAVAKLSTIEQTCHGDRIKVSLVEAKLVTTVKAYEEDHVLLMEMYKENVLIHG